MLKTYNTAQAAYTEQGVAKYYDTVLRAWVEASPKNYDDPQEAWVEQVKRKSATLSVTAGFYEKSGNYAMLSSGLLYIDAKPASSASSYSIKVTTEEGEFFNPVISGAYTFGYSEQHFIGSASYYAHECVRWKLNGYLNGSCTKSVVIVDGSNYSQSTAFGVPFSKTLEGTFDQVELECYVMSMNGRGLFNTQVSDFTVDGIKYRGDMSISS